MSIFSIVLLIGWPGAATAAIRRYPGQPELLELVVSLAILGLLHLWVASVKRQQAVRLREKIVRFPARQPSRLATAIAIVLLGGAAHAQAPAPAATPEPPKVDVTGFVYSFARKI